MFTLKFVAGACVFATAAAWMLISAARDRTVEAGFWFDPVSFESKTLGGTLTPSDLTTIETAARAELTHAFDGLAITISSRRDARFKVRVVQELLDRRMKRTTWIAGSAHAIRGFGGTGAVSFTYFASGALAYAPPRANRSEIVEAIGRGIGRGAAHELAHQLLIGEPLHATRDRASYEYYAASRPEQFYGPMHWDNAAPLLARRFTKR